MDRRAWRGVAAGVVAALLVLGVAGAAYRVGEHHDVVTRTVTDGQVVRVVGDGWNGGWGGGWGGCFFLFPLLVILVVFLLLRRRRWGGGWGGGGYGWCGPDAGPGGGPERVAGSGFDQWHRRAHERAEPEPAGPAGPGEHGRVGEA